MYEAQCICDVGLRVPLNIWSRRLGNTSEGFFGKVHNKKIPGNLKYTLMLYNVHIL